MEDKKNHPPKLKKSMTAGQMETISPGGAIGAGLLMGLISTIKWTGLSVLLAYMFVGLILYIIMRIFGEMLYVSLGTGSFVDYATEHASSLVEYLAEWANVFQHIVVGISEVIVATKCSKFWWSQVSVFWSGIITITFLLLANLVNVKAYGVLESWFAMIKVATIILMIILGLLVILLGVGNYGKPLSFSNPQSHGGLFTGGVKGFFFPVVIIVGSYEGIELIGVSAGEVASLQEVIAKSIKSVLWHILIFYVGTVFVIVTVYPWNQLGNIGSPFVETFTKVGITAAAGIISFVVLTATLSDANSGIYSSSRMLFKLAHEGEALEIFGKLSKHIVPNRTIINITADILFGFVLNLIVSTMNKSIGELFAIVYSLPVLPGMAAWFVILITELKLRKSSVRLVNKRSFKLPLYPYSSCFAFAMLLIIIIFTSINLETRVSVVVGTGVLVSAAIVYAVKHRRKKQLVNHPVKG